MNADYHIPVMLKEAVEGLNISPKGVYVDLTFGGGGHSSEIIKQLDAKGRLLAFDQDQDAFKNALPNDNFELIYGNFRFLKNYLKYASALPVDGILADLGVSSHHFDAQERGFSFRFDAKLDMRMNREGDLTAMQVVNEYSEERLFELFKWYGEIKNAGRLASKIVEARKNMTIETTEHLLNLVEPLAKKHQEHKYFAQVFQALRIEVNQELEALKSMLEQSKEVLKEGGRLVVITYHSLEDRLVKQFFKTGKFSGQAEKDFFGNTNLPFREVNRKVIVPTADELEKNPRSRSAKLRIAERT